MLAEPRFCRGRSCFNLLLVIVAAVSVSCSTPSNVSLDYARRITTDDGKSFTPPPRAGIMGDLVRQEYLDALDETCMDTPPATFDIDEIVRKTSMGCRMRSKNVSWCLGDELFTIGRSAVNAGHYTKAIAVLKEAIKSANASASGEYRPHNVHGNAAQRYRPHLAASYAAIGDFTAARMNLGGGDASYFRSTSGRYQVRANYIIGNAALERMKGNYSKAEKLYLKARKMCIKASEVTAHGVFYDLQTQFLPDLGEVLMMQGKQVEAELVLRESIQRYSFQDGSFNARMRSMVMLGRLYHRQGRYADAELLIKGAIGVARIYGSTCAHLDLNLAHQALAQVLLARDRPQEALAQFETIRTNMRHSEQIFEIRFANDPDWAYALLLNGKYSRAETMLTNALKSARSQYGDSHHRTAEIRGLLAVSQYRLSKIDSAGKNFKKALPVLLKYSRESDAETEHRESYNRRLAQIAEAYMVYVADTRGGDETAAGMTFPLADSIRGQSVQQAVLASSTRAAAKDKQLAELVRLEQDAGKKITGLNAVLINARSQGLDGRKQAEAIQKEIDQLNASRMVILDKIEAAFPAYAELTRPRPKKVDDIKKVIRPDEVLLAYFVGRQHAFVWSIPGSGPARFAVIPKESDAIAKEVKAVRNSVEPQGKLLSQIPDFNVAAAHSLYEALIGPVRSTWKNANHLMIVPHGPLSRMPFTLLATGSYRQPKKGTLTFNTYREVPWLIRGYSISVLPSPGTLITLRSLPAGDDTRRTYAGFGDPVFSKDQAVAVSATQPTAEASIETRAIRISGETSLDAEKLTSVSLDMLHPLPDTRQEVLSIAGALNADVKQDVFLGRAASEATVKKMDLSNRRVLVFATHGLVPGDLDGLRQPALAFSSPAVTGDRKNDGLLTLGEIMALRLNADWVVLSACNTAAGHGAGSEAVSGLGRAFFYAGSRAILVSNWPVESASVRMLTTELFRQQQADPGLSRTSALQRSMLKLMDEGVYRDPHTGKPVFAYAHPIFWAPFSLVGDGGES